MASSLPTAELICVAEPQRPVRPPTGAAYALSSPLAAGRAVVELATDDFAQVLADPEAFWRAHAARPIKLSHSTLIVQAELLIAGQPTRVAFKRASPKSIVKGLIDRLRGSRAERGWHLARRLMACGVATAEPLLVCDERSYRLKRHSYLATRWIDDSTNLYHWLEALAGKPPAVRTRRLRQAALSVGQLLGRMHAGGIENRDLKALNVLIVDRPASVDAYLVDLDGMRVRPSVDRQTRARDLARLAAGLDAWPWMTRTDRLRALQAYMRVAPLDGGDWKQFWRAIAAASRRVQRRLKRSGRPLV